MAAERRSYWSSAAVAGVREGKGVAVADAKGLAAAGRQKRVRARAAQEVLAAEGDLLHQGGQDCQLQRRRKT